MYVVNLHKYINCNTHAGFEGSTVAKSELLGQLQQRRRLGKGLFVLNSSDFRLLRRAKVQTRAYLVPQSHRGATWYRLEVEIEGQPERGVLMSFRNKPRLWKTLNSAVSFLIEEAPQMESVTLMLPKPPVPAPGTKTKKGKKGGKK